MKSTASKMAILMVLLFSSTIHAEMPKPQPNLDEARAKADSCVEPTDVMRREHMEFIEHQRDETVHRGIRSTKHSLKNCINCHVVKGDDGKPVTIESEKHFCRTCHDYASVQIDCFQCHASKPSPGPGSPLKPTALNAAE